MEKIQGVKNFGNEREGRFREILSCPPPKMRVAPQMPPPPQIPRPGAATVNGPNKLMALSCVILNVFTLVLMSGTCR